MSEYTMCLLKMALDQWIIFAVIAPFLLASEVVYMRSKRRMTKKENRDWQNMNNVMLGILAFVFIITLADTFPIIKDVVGKRYISDQGMYTIEHRTLRKNGSGEIEYVVLTTDDGKSVSLSYPRRMDLSKLPTENCYGTVLYSENSHYILDFIPDEDADDN